ncbi:hypothetical protein B0H34DRAFT_723640 [Crassisporium funariophilum]|nr:hypothetical protein B0H34DRAFT_723640 [Crassisporium funariophilum]
MKWLRSCLVDDHRIVLSHGDLNPKNIMLLDGKDDSISVSGIIDWEMGGWYPEYWDSLKALERAVAQTTTVTGGAPSLHS